MSVAPPVQPENEAEAREASNRRNLKALLNLIELGQGSFVFAMVEYDLPRLRDELIKSLKDASTGLQLLTIPLSALPPLDQGRSFSVLDQISELYSALSEGITPDALLITGLEKVLPADLEATDPASQARLTQAIQPLNLGRNILASTYDCPVILFLPTRAMSVFVRNAPDISSWRSGYFQFQSNHDAVRRQIAEVAKRGVGGWALWQIRRRTGESLQREAEELAALISDAEAMEIEPVLMAPLYRRMGWVSAALGNRLLARRMFERLLRTAGVMDSGLIREAGSDDSHLARTAFVELRRVITEASQTGRETDPGDAMPAAERLYWMREAEKGFAGIRKTRGREVVRREQARAALEAFTRAGHTVGASLWGHEKELKRLLELITSVKVNFLTLWGAIGSGRSALVHQGLLPQLEERGGYLPVLVERWDVLGATTEGRLMAAPEERVGHALSDAVRDSMPGETRVPVQKAASLHDACQMAVQTTNKTVVLICDRFEQFFIERPRRRQREPFLKAVSACWSDYNLPFKVLFVLREEYLGSMTDFDGIIPEPLEEGKRLYVPPFSVADAFRVLTQQAANANLGWSESLISRVVADLRQDERVSPADLQMAGATLAIKGIDSEAEYDRIGGVAGLLTDYLDEVLFCFSDRRHPAAMLSLILHQFVTGTMMPQRAPRSPEEVARRTGLHGGTVREALALLQSAGLIERVEDRAGEESPKAEAAGDASNDAPSADGPGKGGVSALPAKKGRADGQIHDSDYYELTHDSLLKQLLKPEDLQLRANRVLERALARHNANPLYLMGLQDWLLVLRHVDREKRSRAPVQWLLRLSVIRFVVNFVVLFALPFAALAGIECVSGFPDKDVERNRIIIRQGVPLLSLAVPRSLNVALDTGLQPDEFDKQKLAEILRRVHWEVGNHQSGILRKSAFQNSLLPMPRDILRCQIDDPVSSGEAFKSLHQEMEQSDTYTVEESDRAALVLAEAVRLHPDLADQVFLLELNASDNDLQLLESAIEAKLSSRDNPLITIYGLDRTDEGNLRLTALVDLLPAHRTLAPWIWATLRTHIAAADPALRGAYYAMLPAVARSDPGLAKSILDFLSAGTPKAQPNPGISDSESSRLAALYEIMGIRAAAKPAEAASTLKTLEAALPKAQGEEYSALAKSLGLAARAKPALARRAVRDIVTLLKRMSVQPDVPLAAFSHAGRALGRAVNANKNDPAAQSEALAVVLQPSVVIRGFTVRTSDCPMLTAFVNAALPDNPALARRILDYWLPDANRQAVPFNPQSAQQRTTYFFHIAAPLLRATNDPEKRVKAAGRMIDPLLEMLKSVEATFKPDGSSDLSDAIGECSAAAPALAAKCLPPLKAMLTGKRESASAHRFAARTIGLLARSDRENARSLALSLLLGPDPDLSEAVQNPWADIVEADAQPTAGHHEIATPQTGRLLENLKGERTLLIQSASGRAPREEGNANTFAVYRRAVILAAARHLAAEPRHLDKSRLRREIEDMRHGPEIHLRVAAYDIFTTEAALRWAAAHAER